MNYLQLNVKVDVMKNEDFVKKVCITILKKSRYSPTTHERWSCKERRFADEGRSEKHNGQIVTRGASYCYEIVSEKSKVQWVPELLERLEFLYVNKSCKIECYGNKTHKIIQNMILS